MKFRFFQNKPKNWILKLLSLSLATMLWYFVAGEDQVDINMLVPIEILNLPANLTISNQYKKDIEVTVRGPRSMIQEMRNRNITRPVDLSGAKPGTIVIKNDENSIPLRRGISIQRLQPTNITLHIDEMVQRKIPIQPVTEGALARGYSLKNITIEPDQLTISGPRNILDRNKVLKTYLIDLKGLYKSITLQVNLNLNQELNELIGETVVTAKIEVSENMVEHTIKNIPVNAKDAKGAVTLEPNKISVKAMIPENLLHDTPEASMLFRAFVPSQNISSPTTKPVMVNGVNVPGHEPIKILSINPQEVMVKPAANGKNSHSNK